MSDRHSSIQTDSGDEENLSRAGSNTKARNLYSSAYQVDSARAKLHMRHAGRVGPLDFCLFQG